MLKMEGTSREDLTLVTLDFLGPANCISRALSKHNIKTVGPMPKKVGSFLHPMKDDLGLGHSIETRISEHHWHIWLHHSEKLAMAEHSITWVITSSFLIPISQLRNPDVQNVLLGK